MFTRLGRVQKKSIGLAVLTAGLILFVSQARADSVIYSNFATPGVPASGFNTNTADSYLLNQEFCSIGGPVSSCPANDVVPAQILGVQFTPASSYTFDEAQLALFLESGTNAVDVYLQADASGLPGSVLSGFQVDNELTSTPAVIQVGASLAGVSLFVGTANPSLLAGTPYWLVANTPAADTLAGWSFSSPTDVSSNPSGATGSCQLAASNFAISEAQGTAGPWFGVASCTRPAFELDGSRAAVPPPSVPEPGSMLLLGTGLAGLLMFWKRERWTRPN